jgi:hypothetical protein
MKEMQKRFHWAGWAGADNDWMLAHKTAILICPMGIRIFVGLVCR